MELKNKKTFFTMFKEFPMINWWLTWVLIFLHSGYDVYNDEYMKTEFQAALKIMKKESEGIVTLDALGRTGMIKKSQISIASKEFQQVVIKNVQENFITDAITLTDNFNNSILNVEELEKFNPKITTEFESIYIKADDVEAKRVHKSFEKYLVYLLTNDKMPEMISITDAKMTSYTVEGNKFNAKITFTLYANIFNATKGDYEIRRGSIISEFEGVFESSLGDINNPLGLFYTSMNPSVLKKGGN